MSSEAVFFHPHYDLINNDIIERKKNAPPPSRAEDQEILAEIARYVENTIITTYGFVAIPIPGENADGIMLPSTSVLASPDWLTASKMLLIVNNASGSLLGIFSRSLCLDQGLSKGSMIPYIERALRAQYAVLILRPNTNSIGEKPNNVPILGSESPEIHALYVWENIVAKAENISYIALLGYGNGASLCKDLLLRQMVRSKEDESEANRIRALITIEASHIVEDDDTVDIKDFVRQVGINLECSRSPRGYELAYRKEKLGSTSVSIGLPPGTTEVLNVAASISLSLNPVFQYLKIAEMGGPVERVFFESFAKECGLNPATSVIHHQPADAEADLQLSATPSKSKSTMAETPKKTFFQRLFGGNKNSPKDQGKEGLDEEKISVNDFDLLKIVGKGAFGKVMLVRKKVGQGAGQIYAMKVLKKSVVAAKGQIENTLSEREILCEMRHPFIVRLRFAFQSEDKLYLVTDYYNGGTLFYHLRKSRQFSEERARFYAAELLLALDHLHSHDIIYRDLKLENVLLDHMGHVALTDFGLSKQNIDKTGGATTFCGTAEYIAPELLQVRKYGKAVDWWSFGILLFEMMYGRTPFFDKNRKLMFYRIINTEPSFPASFSNEAQECIRGLLRVNENERLGSGADGAKDIISTRFFSVLDFEALYRRELTPPFQPEVTNEFDTKYVPKAYLQAEAKDSIAEPVRRGAAAIDDNFKAFTFAGEPTIE